MCVSAPSCGDTPGGVWLDKVRAVVWGWPKTLDAWKKSLPELALAVLLAGKQLVSDRKGSAIRGLSRAPKPTKKWRTWEGREEGWGGCQASYPIPHLVSHLGSSCLGRVGSKGVRGRRGEE